MLLGKKEEMAENPIGPMLEQSKAEGSETSVPNATGMIADTINHLQDLIAKLTAIKKGL